MWDMYCHFRYKFMETTKIMDFFLTFFTLAGLHLEYAVGTSHHYGEQNGARMKSVSPDLRSQKK